VVPVFNEDESLDRFRKEMDAFIALCDCNVSVLFINDGSTDDSREIIEEICSGYEHYSFLTLDKNYGLSTAIKAGIDACRSSMVGYIDADLQTSPEDFLKFLEFFPEYDMVNGIRVNRRDKFIKRMSSKIANSFRRLMINDNIQDTCCPLKIIKMEYAAKIPFFNGMHRFLPALVQLRGGAVKEVPVRHFPRYAGKSKYHLRNRLAGPFLDTLAFRWMRSRNIRYTVTRKADE
jgi:dolichol-phosphate mannosyltransferase